MGRGLLLWTLGVAFADRDTSCFVLALNDRTGGIDGGRTVRRAFVACGR
jgi:hypothetical protein